MKSLSQHIKESYEWIDKFHENIKIDVRTVAEFYSWYDMTIYRSFEEFASRSKTIKHHDQTSLDIIRANWDQKIHRNDLANGYNHKDDMYFKLWSNVYGQSSINLRIDGLLDSLMITKRHRNKYEKV